jgi:hypothetical protein
MVPLALASVDHQAMNGSKKSEDLESLHLIRFPAQPALIGKIAIARGSHSY